MTKLNHENLKYIQWTHIFRHTCTHIKCIHTTHSSHIRWQHHRVSWSPDLQLVILNMQEHDGYMCEDVYFCRPRAFQSANGWQFTHYRTVAVFWAVCVNLHFCGGGWVPIQRGDIISSSCVELKRREFVDDHFYQGTKEPCWGFQCIPYCESTQRCLCPPRAWMGRGGMLRTWLTGGYPITVNEAIESS